MAYKFKNMEKIVGIFIVFAILTILSFLLMIGRGKNLFVKKNLYYTYFSKGEGISKGQKVSFNGIEVGKVTEIRLNKDNRIYVKFFVLRDYSDRVKTTSVVTFSKSLIGGGTMRITKGLVGSRVLPNNTYICSYDSKKGKEYLSQQKSAPEGIDKTLANVNELTGMLKDPEGALALTLVNLQKLSDNLNKITANIANNDDKVDDIFISLQETLDNLVVVTKNLKHNKLLGGHPEKKKNQLINETK